MNRFYAAIAAFCCFALMQTAYAQCPAGQVEITIEVLTDDYGYESYWELTPAGSACGTGTVFAGGNTMVGCGGGGAQAQNPGGYGNNLIITEGPWCLTIGDTMNIHTIDDWGDGGTGFIVYSDGVEIANFPAGWVGNYSDLSYFFIVRDSAFVPTNDDCANSTPITCPSTVSGTTVGATVDSLAAPTCVVNIAAPGVWYSFLGDGSAVTLNFCQAATNFDTRVSVYSGACGTLTCVAGNDDGPTNPGGCSIAEGAGYNFTSQVNFNSSNGVMYYILVHGYEQPGFVFQGEFQMDVSCGAPCSPIPANDDCSGAIALALGNPGACTPDTGTNFCATPALSNPSCDPFGTIQDVWYSFNSGANVELIFNLDSLTATAINFTLYEDSCGGNEVVCINDAYGSISLIGFTPNTTYYLQVWNNGGSQEGDFAICVEQPDPVVDGDMATILFPSEYSLTPIPFVTPWDLTGLLSNAGNQDITNVEMTVDVSSSGAALFSGTTTAIDTLAPLEDSLVTLMPTYTPSLAGDYDVLYTISIAENDTFPTNDSIDWFMTVTDTVLARDFGVDGGLGVGLGQTSILGNLYNIPSSGDLSSISAWIGDIGIGDTTQYVVYDVVNGLPNSEIAASAEYIGTAADTGGVFLTLPINGGPYTLPAGDFYIGVKEYNSTDNLSVGYSDFIYTQGAAVGSIDTLGFDSLENLGNFQVAFVVRANFGLNCALSTTGTVTDATCIYSTDGDIDLTPSGGSTYTYLWSTGATSQDVNSLAPGTYFVTVAEPGCVTAVDTFMVGPDSLLVSAVVTDDFCSTGSGQITASSMGGSTPHSYLWSNGDTTVTTSNLFAASYDLTVTDSLGCTTTGSWMVGDSTVSFNFTTSTTDEICGDAGGVITATASGGVGPYDYDWNTGDSTTILLGLSAGTYTITATDANGCADSLTLVLIDTTITISVNTTVNQATCGDANGTISVAPSNGQSPYTYAWNSGPATAAISNLDSGLYVVTITDNNGCTGVDSTAITNTQGVAFTTSSNQSSCGMATGDATVTTTSGSMPFTYTWDSNAGSQTTANATGLSAGVYGVTVEDATGCIDSTSVAVSDAGTLAATTSTTDVTCGAADGSATVMAMGGTMPYTYAWGAAAGGQTDSTATGLGLGMYSVTVTDGAGCTYPDIVTVGGTGAVAFSSSTTNANCGANDGSATVVATSGVAPFSYMWGDGQTSQTATGLSQGNITVMVTDSNMCVDSATIFVNANAVPVVASSVVVDASCNGAADGSITVTMSGGAPPFVYIWSNNSDTSNTSSTTQAASLSEGIYNLVVTDASGCFVNHTDTIGEPDVIAVADSVTSPSCFGVMDGAIDLTTMGGTMPYTYAWAGGQTTEDLSGILGGTYSYTVTDANGCTENGSATVVSPAAINLSLNVSDISCNGEVDGAIGADVTGGTGGFTYLWDGAQTADSLSGLAAGTYTVTVTDATGCTATDDGTVTEPSVLIAGSASTDVNCLGGSDGNASASAAGGTPPFAFAWSNGVMQNGNLGIPAGDYTVTVTDSRGCTATSSVTIIEPATGITIAIDSITTESGSGASDGGIAISVTDGVAPYTYAWTGGSTNEDLSGVSTGTYTVTVTDADGCSMTATDSVPLNTGITELFAGMQLNIVPNPNNGQFRLDFVTSESRNLNLTILNSLGAVVYRERLTVIGNSSKQMNLSSLDRGVYFLVLHNEAGTMTRRVVVQ